MNHNITDVELVEIDNTLGLLDLDISEGKFTSVTGLETALDVSLLQDGRAGTEQVNNPIYAKGWPASSAINDTLGSLLWLLQQKRSTTENLNAAIDFAQKCLSWLVRDRYATSVIVNGALISGGFSLDIIIKSTSGPEVRRQLDLLRATV